MTDTLRFHFDNICTDDNEDIDIEDFVDYYYGVFEREYVKKYWDELMKEVKEDPGEDQRMDFQEYCKFMTEKFLDDKDLFVSLSDSAFGAIDDDGGGSITEIEFRDYMNKSFSAMEISLVWNYMLSFDEDDDREISKDEFVDIIDYLYEPYSTKIMNNFDFWAILVPLVCKVLSILVVFISENDLIAEIFEQIEGFADILFLISALSQIYESEEHTDLMSKLMLLYPVQDAAKRKKIRHSLISEGLIDESVEYKVADSDSTEESSATKEIRGRLLELQKLKEGGSGSGEEDGSEDEEKSNNRSDESDEDEEKSKSEADKNESNDKISPCSDITNEEKAPEVENSARMLQSVLVNRFAKDVEEISVEENVKEDKKSL